MLLTPVQRTAHSSPIPELFRALRRKSLVICYLINPWYPWIYRGLHPFYPKFPMRRVCDPMTQLSRIECSKNSLFFSQRKLPLNVKYPHWIDIVKKSIFIDKNSEYLQKKTSSNLYEYTLVNSTGKKIDTHIIYSHYYILCEGKVSYESTREGGYGRCSMTSFNFWV